MYDQYSQMPEIMELFAWGQKAKKQLKEREIEREEQARKDNMRIIVAKILDEARDRINGNSCGSRTSNYYQSLVVGENEEEEDYDPFWQLKVLDGGY